MKNYDDLFTEQDSSEDKGSFDVDEYIARKKSERDGAYSMIEEATEKMQGSGELFRQYLDVQAHFDRYSVSNAILIAAQKPDAVGPLKTFDDWKAESVSIAKGAKAITILEPGKEYEHPDGSKGVNYNVKRVFDITQTQAKPKENKVPIPDERTLLKSLITNAPCKMKIKNDMAENTNAIYKADEKTIFVRQGMDGPDIFRALTQELAQAHMDKGADYQHSDNYVPAYCVSYILCKRFEVDTTPFNFRTLPEKYNKMEPKDFRTELVRIRDVAGEISKDMNRAMEQLQRVSQSHDEPAR